MHSKHTRGQALVEFALITPLLILLTVLIFDFGRILFAYTMSPNALRNALRNAQVIGYDGTDTIYANCGLFREHLRKASFVGTPTITIRYQKASDGSFISCHDGVDAIDLNEYTIDISGSNLDFAYDPTLLPPRPPQVQIAE